MKICMFPMEKITNLIVRGHWELSISSNILVLYFVCHSLKGSEISKSGNRTSKA